MPPAEDEAGPSIPRLPSSSSASPSPSPSPSAQLQSPPPTAAERSPNRDSNLPPAPQLAPSHPVSRKKLPTSSHPDGTHSAPLASIFHTPDRSANSSGTLSPTPDSQQFQTMPHGSHPNPHPPHSGSRGPGAPGQGGEGGEGGGGEKPKRRVQWARAPNGPGSGGDRDHALEEGPDAQEHKESRARRKREERDERERLERELDERGLNKDAFLALRSALQTHQRSQLLSSAAPTRTSNAAGRLNEADDPLSPSAIQNQLDVYVPSDQTFGLPAPEPPSTGGERDPEKAGGADDPGGGRGAGGRWAFLRTAHKLVHRPHLHSHQPHPSNPTPTDGRPEPKPLQPPPPSSSEEPSPLKPSTTFSSLQSGPQGLNLQGRGVLASLLAMYDHPDESRSGSLSSGGSSGLSSGVSSVGSSPEGSEDEREFVAREKRDAKSEQREDKREMRNGVVGEKRRSRLREEQSGEEDGQEEDDEKAALKREEKHAREERQAESGEWTHVERARTLSGSTTSLPAQPPPKPQHASSDPSLPPSSNNDPQPKPRTRKTSRTSDSFSRFISALSPGPGTPPAAKSGGGVLGSLIATTGNLSGAAAPVPSSLAPQVGRSGFHVARYDMQWPPPGLRERQQPGEGGDEGLEGGVEWGGAWEGMDVDEERRRMKEERRRSWTGLGWGIGDGTGWAGSRPSSRAGSRGASRRGSMEDLRESEGEVIGEKTRGEFVSSPRPMQEDLALSRASTIQPSGPQREDLSRATTASSDTPAAKERELKRAQWPGMLSLPKLTMSRISSRESIPDEYGKQPHKRSSSYFSFKHKPSTPEEEEKLELERRKEAERRRRKKQKKRRMEKEIFITMHVAAVLQRQEFLLKLARALMMFGAPTHRLEALIQATGRVLDMNVSCVHLPSLMLLSFNDDTTRTSETKFLKQPQALDLERLQDVHAVYDAVIHDRTGVKEASDRLDEIMRAKSRYRNLVAILIGGLCSAFITPISFSGSFLDAILAFPLGCLLVLIQQIASKNELFTHVFEIVVALLLSFISAALAATNRVCYAAVASGSIVLILPGFIVLTGALELASRNIISGSVRLMYSVIYSLFLGFGLAIGGEFYTAITGQQVIGLGLANGVTCPVHDPNGPWWQKHASAWWAFLCVPGFSLALSLRNQAPWNRREFLVMILISCAGWTTNHFSGLKFVNRTDIVATLGAFVVGVCGNVYGRFFASGMSFVVMVTGILFQVPSSINGLLSFASLANSGGDSYSAGFSIAEQLIEVSIGLTVGLFLAAVITHPFESRRRGYGLFSF